MDLRDKFAAYAMNGFIAGCCSQRESAPIGELSHSYMAQVAYEVADCMIEARKTSNTKVAAPLSGVAGKPASLTPTAGGI